MNKPRIILGFLIGLVLTSAIAACQQAPNAKSRAATKMQEASNACKASGKSLASYEDDYNHIKFTCE